MPYFKANFEETWKSLDTGKIPSYCRYPVWFPRDGENLIRILPPWNERGIVFKILSLHWFGSGDNRIATICRRQFGQKCYICEVIQKLLASEVLTKDKANYYLPKKRAFCNGIDLKELDKGVQIMSLPTTKVVKELLIYASDPDFGDFTHPEKGYDIKILRMLQGNYPDYKVIPKRGYSAIPKEVDWEGGMFNLDDFENVWILHSYQEQKNLWEIYSDIVSMSSEDELEMPLKQRGKDDLADFNLSDDDKGWEDIPI